MSRSPTRADHVEESLPLNSSDFFVLAALSTGMRHGYGIVKDIESRTHGKVRMRPGNLYRVLDRLVERGLVEVAKEPGGESPAGVQRVFRITTVGRRTLRAHLEAVADMVDASRALSFSTRKG